jgi:hypothetical protein
VFATDKEATMFKRYAKIGVVLIAVVIGLVFSSAVAAAVGDNSIGGNLFSP